MKRLIVDILLFISIFILPWWVTAILGFFGLFLFKHFYEFLIISAMIYALFSIPGDKLIDSKIWFPVIIGIIYIGSQILRRYIILYKN